jgi:hypothetical protein
MIDASQLQLLPTYILYHMHWKSPSPQNPPSQRPQSPPFRRDAGALEASGSTLGFRETTIVNNHRLESFENVGRTIRYQTNPFRIYAKETAPSSGPRCVASTNGM